MLHVGVFVVVLVAVGCGGRVSEEREERERKEAGRDKSPGGWKIVWMRAGGYYM